MIKITGGSLKGRVVKVLSQDTLRPTTSFFREWIFNVLNSYTSLDTFEVIDLFAGSGVVGFEFLSRGALKVSAVEKSGIICKQLKQNSEKLGINNYFIYKDSAENYLRKYLAFSRQNPVVFFMDAPYTIDIVNNLLSEVKKNIVNLSSQTILLIETDKNYELDLQNIFEIYREKISGKTKFSILILKL